MKISDLLHLSQKPPAYTPGTAVMWTDPHISEQLLAVHLSQETDLASRKTPAIEAGLAFIRDQCQNIKTTSRLDILDLGCGPGLYTEKLADLGHRVTGMDFSRSSITYALESARQKELDITYICQDYLTLADDKQYDLAMMIFMDFGALFPKQQAALLERVYQALKPGGMFIFDVLNTTWTPDPSSLKAWDITENGFWRPGPCLTLSETFAYDTGSADRGLYLNQHLVADDERTTIYRFYTQTFSDTSLKSLLSGHGFKDIQCDRQVVPDGDLYDSSQVTFCRAVK